MCERESEKGRERDREREGARERERVSGLNGANDDVVQQERSTKFAMQFSCEMTLRLLHSFHEK